MKHVIIGIFAHPDDESFGPSGTLLLETANGADVHLICATGGESGNNPDEANNLATIRINEWQIAGTLLGASSQHHLGYFDGELRNNLFLQIAKDVEEIVIATIKKYPKNTKITLLTMDQNGISGHIDHIVMSFVASYVFVKLREQDDRLRELHYFCVDETQLPKADTSFVFRSKGRSINTIDKIVDISEVFDKKKQIMRAHKSQRSDAEMLIERFAKANPPKECFYFYKD